MCLIVNNDLGVSLFIFHFQISSLDEVMDVASAIPSFCFTEWLDEFLYRLFSLLQHLEPNSVLYVVSLISFISCCCHMKVQVLVDAVS